jgi:hypothetical protein
LGCDSTFPELLLLGNDVWNRKVIPDNYVVTSKQAPGLLPGGIMCFGTHLDDVDIK